MWCSREKVVASVVSDFIISQQLGGVSSLSHWVAAEIDDLWRLDLVDPVYDAAVQTSSRRINDQLLAASDVVER